MSTAGPVIYTLRVGGHLDDHWSGRLDGLILARHGDGTSTLTGPVADQAQLHGLLAGLRDIGAALLDVRAGGSAEGDAPEADGPLQGAVLRTERLTLRAAVAGDADDTWRFRRAEQVAEWLTERAGDLDAYRAYFTEPRRLATSVVVQVGHEDGQVIGDLMLRRSNAWAQQEVADAARGVQAELGWVFDPAHQGRGYATEAVREVVRYCFADLGVRRVTAECFLENRASWRLMERIGMRRETHAVRDALHRSGRWLDSLGYALLAEESAARSGPPEPPSPER